MTRLALTVDIEDWYHVPSVTGSPFSVYPDVDAFFKSWDERYDYLSKPTERVLDIFDEYDIRATFFIVADVVDNYPGLVESIIERGHEIGCHGLHHECYLDPKTRRMMVDEDTFRSKTEIARDILGKVAKQRIVGYRAPNALFGEWMYEPLTDLGFKYDSSVSVNSFVSKSDVDHGSFSTKPVVVNDSSFVEFPFPYWEVFKVKIPTSGGPYLRFLGSRVVMKGIKQSLKRGCTVFYFHPIDMSDEDFPQVGRGRPYYWAVKGKVVENRIVNIIQQIKRMGVEVDTLSRITYDIISESGRQ